MNIKQRLLIFLKKLDIKIKNKYHYFSFIDLYKGYNKVTIILNN
jgi:hypothetical protein